MALAYQTSNFAYQGQGQFVYQEGPAATGIFYQGDGKKRRRRDRTQELFAQIEVTLRSIMSPPQGVEIGTAKAAREEIEPQVRAALATLDRIGRENTELTARAKSIRREMIAWKRERDIEDEDDDWMVMN